MTEQQQQQQLPLHDDDNLAAQRAAMEAIDIGRATVLQADQQGQQLDRATQLGDETQATLDQAGRVLRGMTWSGWMANLWSSNGDPVVRTTQPSLRYETWPAHTQHAIQALGNYRANVQVLEACETAEQRETCTLVCENMFAMVQTAIGDLDAATAYAQQLRADVKLLRERQQRARQQYTAASTKPDRKPEPVTTAASSSSPQQLQQDEHLHVLSTSLQELGHLANSLQSSLAHQSETVDRLDTQSESILVQSERVTRRAERMVQQKSWTPAKPTYVGTIALRHQASGRYWSVGANGAIVLVPTLSPACLFRYWKRPGSSLMGLQSCTTQKWCGQTLFGSLVCTASRFGHREEWQIEEGEDVTRLLCASAGWGAGGYVASQDERTPTLIGSNVADRAKADLWTLEEHNDD